MANKRKEVEAFIIKYITKLLPSVDNANIYKRLFAGMTDGDFDKFIDDLDSSRVHLCMMAPNSLTAKLSVENNLEIAKELGHNFFERLWIGASGDTPEHLTAVEHLVIDLPLRRNAQTLVKKISVPGDNKTVDAMTGQPTGSSKGAKISYTELQLCAGMGLDNTMVELIKYRGGDSGGKLAYETMLSKTGHTNLQTLSRYATGVVSTQTLKTYLYAMNLKPTGM